jgi:hypothetical protein
MCQIIKILLSLSHQYMCYLEKKTLNYGFELKMDIRHQNDFNKVHSKLGKLTKHFKFFF